MKWKIIKRKDKEEIADDFPDANTAIDYLRARYGIEDSLTKDFLIIAYKANL